jgi:LacI family transcriptional regulator
LTATGLPRSCLLQGDTTDSERLTGRGSSSARTLYDVAREAGVSTATVSRVMHGQDGVRSSTRQRVLEVIEALGYVPDSSAQSMGRRRKEVVGLVAIESRGPATEIEHEGLLFIEEVLRGVESSLSSLGWPVLISVRRTVEGAAVPRQSDGQSHQRQPDKPPDNQGDLYQWLRRMAAKVDGLLIAEGFEPTGRLAELAARVPVVLIAGSPGPPQADVVAADNRAGVGDLVSHLVEGHGLTSFWYVDGPPEAPDARERRAAFDEALARYPGARLAGCSEGRFAALSGQAAVREVLAAAARPGDLPGALVCANDQMAIGAIRELRSAGVRVPADIAVTGFDDVYLGALLTPPLTTVHQPMRRLGERATSLLLERIAEPGLPRRVERLPTRLVVRESCGCHPGDASPDGSR